MEIIYQKQHVTGLPSRRVEVYREGEGYHFNIYDEHDTLIHCQADKVFRGEPVPEMFWQPFKTAELALAEGNRFGANRSLKRIEPPYE